jgi:hypothetical protein
VCILHAGSGKTTTLEGSRARDTRGSPDGDGLVHLAIDELYQLVHGKAVTVGEQEVPPVLGCCLPSNI